MGITSASRRRIEIVRRQTVIEVDCLEHMRCLPNGYVDVIVASPPYNIGKDYGAYDDTSDRNDYLFWMAMFLYEARRVLADDGSLFLNVGGTSKDPWVPMQVAIEAGKWFHLQNSIVWVKSMTVGGETHGQFTPINSPRFLNNCWESILHLTKTGRVPIERLAIGVPFADKRNVDRFKHEVDLHCGGNVWHIPYETITSRDKDRGGHPATFPVELPETCIRLHGVRPLLRVLDPFLGSGTTLVACHRLGLAGTGIEMDPNYVEQAVRRIEKDADEGPS